MPIGTVIAWPISSDPTGADEGKWLECDGQIINTVKYPKLAALMTRTPDYRGMFLRGLGSQSYSQSNGSLYGVTSTIYSSANLGQIQGDSIRNIKAFYQPYTNHLANNASGAFCNTGSSRGGVGEMYLPGLEFDASRVVPTATENRPVNIAVRYLIRAA